MACKVKSKNKRWLYSGIVTGFFSGFIYFAIGVYTHSHHSQILNMNVENESYKFGKTR